MASPKLEVFFLYSPTTGAPVAGLLSQLSFDTYKDSSGTNLAQPTISEIGGGAYAFTPTFADPTKGIVYVVNTGTTTAVTPTRVARYMRPEDWNTDNSDAPVSAMIGGWEIVASGPNANTMIIYAPDGVTKLYQFNLFDIGGNPTTTNVAKRVRTL